MVRSNRDPQELAVAMRAKLWDLDAELPPYIETWSKGMDPVLFASRMAAISLGVLGVMGAMLAVTGIFGMSAYSVSKRLIDPGNSGEPCAGFHRLYGNTARSAGIGCGCCSYGVRGACGYLDSRATRAVARSFDTAARGMN